MNARDFNGYTPLHFAAARGDNEMIKYLVSKGADVKAVARTGQTTADMANGPVQRISPFLDTVALLESLGREQSPLRVVLALRCAAFGWWVIPPVRERHVSSSPRANAELHPISTQ